MDTEIQPCLWLRTPQSLIPKMPLARYSYKLMDRRAVILFWLAIEAPGWWHQRGLLWFVRRGDWSLLWVFRSRAKSGREAVLEELSNSRHTSANDPNVNFYSTPVAYSYVVLWANVSLKRHSHGQGHWVLRVRLAVFANWISDCNLSTLTIVTLMEAIR